MVFRTLTIAFLVMVLGACAAGSSRNVVMVPQVVNSGNATLSLEVVAGVGQYQTLVDAVRETLLADLNQRSGFRGAVANLDDSDYVLVVKILDAKDVGGTKRAMLGAMAGRAKIVLQATLFQRGSDLELGIVEAEGKSSGGTIFAGTNDQAIANASNEIVRWLAGVP